MAGDEEKKKVYDPYKMTSADVPGVLITQVQLKGDNYEEWARAMRIALRAKRKYGFVDGSVKKPADGESVKELQFQVIFPLNGPWK